MSASPWKDVYLVVGGSGFLGRHIVQSLKNCGDAVSVFDIVQRHDDVPFYAGDISEAGVFLSAVKQVSALRAPGTPNDMLTPSRAVPPVSYIPHHRHPDCQTARSTRA
jgi:NAD(P)-dependent dehydrogenase (short-subunit alcohol dehydrogenase family)